MKIKIPIRVTQEHIDAGVRRTCNLCPLTFAIEEVLGMPVRVSHSLARRTNKPRKVENFIRHYDNGYDVKPFKFKLIIHKAF